MFTIRQRKVVKTRNGNLSDYIENIESKLFRNQELFVKYS